MPPVRRFEIGPGGAVKVVRDSTLIVDSGGLSLDGELIPFDEIVGVQVPRIILMVGQAIPFQTIPRQPGESALMIKRKRPTDHMPTDTLFLAMEAPVLCEEILRARKAYRNAKKKWWK